RPARGRARCGGYRGVQPARRVRRDHQAGGPGGRRHPHDHRRPGRYRGAALAATRIGARRAVPASGGPEARTAWRPQEGMMPKTVDRRKFLAATGVTATMAVAAGVAGELLIDKRFRKGLPKAMAAPGTSGTSGTSSAP